MTAAKSQANAATISATRIPHPSAQQVRARAALLIEATERTVGLGKCVVGLETLAITLASGPTTAEQAPKRAIRLTHAPRLIHCSSEPEAGMRLCNEG